MPSALDAEVVKNSYSGECVILASGSVDKEKMFLIHLDTKRVEKA